MSAEPVDILEGTAFTDAVASIFFAVLGNQPIKLPIDDGHGRAVYLEFRVLPQHSEDTSVLQLTTTLWRKDSDGRYEEVALYADLTGGIRWCYVDQSTQKPVSKMFPLLVVQRTHSEIRRAMLASRNWFSKPETLHAIFGDFERDWLTV